jgi:hypothetical protein
MIKSETALNVKRNSRRQQMSSDKPNMTVDAGEGLRMRLIKEGKMEKGITFQSAKPSNVVAPAKLPIPPAPPTSTGNNKK